jgi:hypothetical protein
MQKPENWSELTWQEKREARFEWWRAARGVNFQSPECPYQHRRRGVPGVLRRLRPQDRHVR